MTAAMNERHDIRHLAREYTHWTDDSEEPPAYALREHIEYLAQCCQSVSPKRLHELEQRVATLEQEKPTCQQ